MNANHSPKSNRALIACYANIRPLLLLCNIRLLDASVKVSRECWNTVDFCEDAAKTLSTLSHAVTINIEIEHRLTINRPNQMSLTPLECANRALQSTKISKDNVQRKWSD